jgi:hypothetical protein
VIAPIEASDGAASSYSLGQLKGRFNCGGAGGSDRLDDHIELAWGENVSLDRFKESSLLDGVRVQAVKNLARA